MVASGSVPSFDWKSNWKSRFDDAETEHPYTSPSHFQKAQKMNVALQALSPESYPEVVLRSNKRQPTNSIPDTPTNDHLCDLLAIMK